MLGHRSFAFRDHLAVAFVIRLLLIAYAEWQDSWSAVRYTDIDYDVVTDGARHVLAGRSPFERHTFRYSPLLAYALLGNLLWTPVFGKILFSLADLLVGLLIERIVRLEYAQNWQHAKRNAQRNAFCRHGLHKLFGDRSTPMPAPFVERYAQRATRCACLWLYNPLTAVIASRGNGDAISCALVLGTLLTVMHIADRPHGDGAFWPAFGAGMLHGLSVHLRIYPLVYSGTYYLFLGRSSGRRGFWPALLRPSGRQCGLVAGTLATLLALTGLFYALYGYEFVHETYVYHAVRKDTRHNFSLFFYMQYLQTAGASLPPLLVGLLTSAPTLLILATVTVQLSDRRAVLALAIFLHTFVLVSFNSVLTSQYFVWYLALLPVCVSGSRWTRVELLRYGLIWTLAQGLWLMSAYQLEFRGWNTFHWVWLSGCLFFVANALLAIRIVHNFVPKGVQ